MKNFYAEFLKIDFLCMLRMKQDGENAEFFNSIISLMSIISIDDMHKYTGISYLSCL